ncbi:L-Ala-D/L-Glu epimerase [Microbulbifer sediminum]|uniref:L-Ala-D/L-Glu epimerase n=1 Tax=Microbulbifer sediminum TaxID=2904250 RepID=UPI001EFFA431|nr:L-Ala-D/L-Glu epimerase [Microbulbifer sediminum]
MRARCYAERWPLRTSFVISRGTRTEAEVVVVEVSADGLAGVGECTPYPRYGESVESVLEQLRSVLPAVENGLDRIALQSRMPAGAARNALDCALMDLERRRDRSGRPGPESLATVQTLVIDSPEAMAAAAAENAARGVETLKLKLDDSGVGARVRAVRAAAPDTRLVIDANESWQRETLAGRCKMLAGLGVTMLEQPLPADDDGFLASFPHPLPICADESCHTREDLPRLRGLYDMVNIKLDKTGGITEALALANEAREQGFELMLGCMLCTSRAIRAAWALGEQVRLRDLDGPTWLAQDVQPPLRFEAGRVFW